MHEPDAERTGVIAPPPVLYIGALVLALGLEWLAPLALGLGPIATVLGGALVVAGAGLDLWGVLTLRRHTTPVHPTHPASRLVRSGPFGWSRNPLYVGLNAGFVGLVLLLDSGWGLIVFPALLLIMHFGVIRREEAHLRARFGAELDDYCVRVRRYL